MTIVRAIDSYGATHVGRRRTVNEDQFLIADLSKSMTVSQTSLDLDQPWLLGRVQGSLLAVADGMGGHVAGDHASRVAVQTLTRYILNTMPWFFRLGDDREDDLRDELKACLRRCEQVVESEGKSEPTRQGMGTTLTVAYVLWPRAFVVHAGDSRCYVQREGQLTQITRDHTAAQVLVDAGKLPPEKAEDVGFAHVVTNAIVAGGEAVKPEVTRVDLVAGDTLFLCTDGLTKHVSDDEIARILQRSASNEQACTELINAANHGGGTDNITVVLSRYASSQ